MSLRAAAAGGRMHGRELVVAALFEAGGACIQLPAGAARRIEAAGTPNPRERRLTCASSYCVFASFEHPCDVLGDMARFVLHYGLYDMMIATPLNAG